MDLKLIQWLRIKDAYNIDDLSATFDFTRYLLAMRLNQASDFALRVLMFVATNQTDLSKIDDISKRYNISRAHLMKIVNRLARAGLLQTVRGRNGGLRLNLSPEDIRIGDVVRAIEEDFALVECMRGHENKCIITSACHLTAIFAEALAEFLNVLDRYTLADVTQNRNELQNILFARVVAREKSNPAA